MQLYVYMLIDVFSLSVSYSIYSILFIVQLFEWLHYNTTEVLNKIQS